MSKKPKTMSYDDGKCSPESSEEYEWIEKPKEDNSTHPSSLTRDSWMTDHSFFPTIPSKRDQKAKDKREKERSAILTKPGQSSRELNPYWKDGGTGLPREDERRRKSYKIGDQGVDWLRRALHRAEQQAKEENRSLEDIAAERWGSLAKLKSLIKEAEEKSRKDKRKNDDRRESVRDRKFVKPNDEYERKYERPKSSHRSWKRHDDHQGTEGWRKHDKHRKKEEKPKSEGHEAKEVSTKYEPEVNKVLTDAEMNALAAKLLKAEIMQNTALIKELTEKLERARNARKGATEHGENVVVLTRKDIKGYNQPIKFTGGIETNMKDLVMRENLVSSKEQNMQYSKLMTKGKTAEYDLDDLFMDKMKNDTSMADRRRAIMEHERNEEMLDNCIWCLDSKQSQTHLVIYRGSKCYLAAPSFQSLTEDHCIIIPIHHASSSISLDEDVYEELQNFRKKLVRLFQSQDRDVIFYEYAMNLNKYPHTVIHCVPVPSDVGNLAPIYFKKAILECEKEWADNVKLIDLNKNGIQRSIPKGLPYFMVNFGNEDGFAHVIEEEKYFPRNFAQEVIGGMLDLDHSIWRKQTKDDLGTQCKKVHHLKELWKKYE